mgnify:CR=1 FL=1
MGLSCNQRPDGATDDTTTTAGVDSGTFGVSETGAAPTTSGTGDGATTDDPLSGGVMTGDTGHTTAATTSGADANTSSSSSTDTDPPSGTTGFSCGGAVGDSTHLQPPINECEPGPCEPGEVCVVRLNCPEIPNLCDDDDIPEWEDNCYVEQSPRYCVPIPEACERDPQGIEVCLEGWEDCFGYEECLCRYGGEYHQGVLVCHYALDQCSEGGYYEPYCTDLYP